MDTYEVRYFSGEVNKRSKISIILVLAVKAENFQKAIDTFIETMEREKPRLDRRGNKSPYTERDIASVMRLD